MDEYDTKSKRLKLSNSENLIFKAGQHPSSSALPQAWVLEFLANVKEIGVNTLINIFKTSPKITSDVGRKAREMASLRILERLFDPDAQLTKSHLRAPNSGVSFDFSERCEDVLRRILRETHERDIWSESEKSKWDAQPFIAHKRSCLIKSDFKQPNGTVVEGRPPYLISLKQMVKSLRLNQPLVDDEVCQDASSERTITESSSDNDGDDMDEGTESRLSSDDWYNEEMNNIAAKKQVFFSINCKDGQVPSNKKEANRCMKCNKGGQMLICSSDSCSFVFHESCLVCTSSFECDSSGKFCCLFCRYSQSITDYWMVKKKASLARNDLVSFTNPSLKDIPKTSEIPNGVLNSDLPNKSSENGGKEGCNERSSEQPDYMDLSSRKQINPCTSLIVPRRRRVPVPWTQLEEETLKKWMEKFLGASSNHDRYVPWSKILELGASVFQKGRKPGDLKDKWRNMKKASRNST